MPDQDSAPETGANTVVTAADAQLKPRVEPKPAPLTAAEVVARFAAGDGTDKAISKFDILKSNDRTYQIVAVPEWGGSVVVRNLSGTERDAFEASMVLMKGKERIVTTQNVRAKLAVLSIVDPSDPTLSARLFTDAEVAALGAKSALALDRVYAVAADLSGISEKDVEELAGNSEAAGSDGSSLNSQ